MSPILNKLRKLMNHEKSARRLGNIAEAEAFAAKAQNISAGRPIGGDDHHCGAYSRGRAHADSVALSGRKALEENAA